MICSRFSVLLGVVLLSFSINTSCVKTQDAKWIVHPDEITDPNQWLLFRTTVSLGRKPSGEVIADIATDSKYWLYINGKPVVFEGGLKRGPNPEDTYMDKVDIGPYLQRGENTIGVMVWFFGKHGFSHKCSGLPGLYFSAKAGQNMIVSDSTWKVIHHPSFGNTPEGPYPNYRLPESNILFDARKDIGEWFSPGFETRHWNFARENGIPPVEPWNKLIERPIPLWKNYGSRNYEDNVPELPLKITTDTIIEARLPYNAQITPGFTINARAGMKIVVKTDNYRGGSEYNVRAEYITRDGIQTFETPGWMNGHYVHYEIPTGVEIIDLIYRETGYNTEFTGYFKSDDPFLDLLWQKSQRSLYINMRDTYYDCPDRERAQWWGDVTLQLEQSFYAFDRQSDHLARKGILELTNWQRADSTIYSPVPAGNWDRELPMQMLASIGYYGFWNYYYYSGDEDVLKWVYPGVRRYLYVWKTFSDGLVIPRAGGWTWGDWGDNRDMTLLFNLWYSLALKGFENMALLLGHNEDALWAAETNKKLKEKFHQEYWDGTKYRSPEYEGKTDDRPHALAVLAGIVPPENYPNILEVFKNEHHASPYMEKYVLQALIKMGYTNYALERMKQRYSPMVESSLTTLWEGWGIGAEGFGGGSYNHGWSGGPLTLLSRYVAGLAPAGPGFSAILFQPHPGHLTMAEANAVTSYGSINVSFRRETNSFIQQINSPEGIELTLGIPKLNLPVSRIRVNDVIIWMNGDVKENPIAGFLHQTEDHLFFKLQSGNYLITTDFNRE